MFGLTRYIWGLVVHYFFPYLFGYTLAICNWHFRPSEGRLKLSSLFYPLCAKLNLFSRYQYVQYLSPLDFSDVRISSGAFKADDIS